MLPSLSFREEVRRPAGEMAGDRQRAGFGAASFYRHAPIMSPGVKDIAFAVGIILLILAVFAYAAATRRCLQRLREVAAERPGEEARREWMGSEEYHRLRRAALVPMLAATAVFFLLVWLLR